MATFDAIIPTIYTLITRLIMVIEPFKPWFIEFSSVFKDLGGVAY